MCRRRARLATAVGHAARSWPLAGAWLGVGLGLAFVARCWGAGAGGWGRGWELDWERGGGPTEDLARIR